MQVEAVVGLHNAGDESYNITAIFGSLNAAHDYNLFFQNFSGMVRSPKYSGMTQMYLE